MRCEEERDHEGREGSHLYTSIRRYMEVRRMKAMLAVAIMKLMDQRFLLMGIRPSFKEKPESAPARQPVTRAQASHLLTLACQSLWTRRTRPAATPSQQRNTLVRQPSKPSGS